MRLRLVYETDEGRAIAECYVDRLETVHPEEMRTRLQNLFDNATEKLLRLISEERARVNQYSARCLSALHSGRDGSRPGSLLAVAYVDRSTSAESKDAQS